LAVLLAAGLLQPWLLRSLEAAVLALPPPAVATAPGREALMAEQQRQLAGGSVAATAELHAWKQQRFGEQAYQRFLERGSQLDQLWFSLLQTSDPHLAQEWFFQLREGEVGFGELAADSLGPERFSGGRLGPLRLQDLQSPLDRLLQRCLPGAVQPPLTLPSGRVLLVRLDQRLAARWDEAQREALVDELHRLWLGRVLDQLAQQPPAPGTSCSILLP